VEGHRGLAWALAGIGVLLTMTQSQNEILAYLNSVSRSDSRETLQYREASDDWVHDPERHRGEYVVQEGDTVCAIAIRWGMSCGPVERANAERYDGQFKLPVAMRLYLPLEGQGAGR